MSCWIHPGAQSTLGELQWDLLVSEHNVGFQIKIGRPKFYAGEMIVPAKEFCQDSLPGARRDTVIYISSVTNKLNTFWTV